MNRDEQLYELAREANVQVHWHDAAGNGHQVSPEVLRRVLQALGLPADSAHDIAASRQALRSEARACPAGLTAQVGQPFALPPCIAAGSPWQIRKNDLTIFDGRFSSGPDGRAMLELALEPGYYRMATGEMEFELALAPARCISVADVAGAQPRLWGVSAQLYSLRREPHAHADPGGLGDYTALARLAGLLAARGSAALAVSPTHAMFAAAPDKYSPYAPSSRLFLNVLHIDPAHLWPREAIAVALLHNRLGERLLALDQVELIDWPQVARLRLQVLRSLHDDFPANAPPMMVADFQAFRQAGGELLERHARFEALHARQSALGRHDWRQWDADLRDPESDAVHDFAQANAREVQFHALLQWLARQGLAHAHHAAKEGGMPIGLMADLAVGADPAGSHAWSRQQDILTGLSPGAPPDSHNPLGQAWGLTAFSPRALRQSGFAAYRELLQAALSCAGGLRIDHALGLQRMWLVPEGEHPLAGAYVNYPFDDLMRLIALESYRHRAVIMGENLGTVPEGFDERIAARGMLGMSVLWFEREAAAGPAFRQAADWNPHHIATTSTHDLPTVAGWWQGRDLDWRTRLDLLGNSSEATERATREADRQALWQVLRRAGQPLSPPAEPPVDAAIRHVAATPSPLVLLPLEDVLGLHEQPNLPGTVHTHPNWCRRLPVTVEALPEHTAARLGILNQTRQT